jgi:hypothetical protein
MNSWNIGDWCWHVRLASPCRVIDREVLWGDVFFHVWLPAKDAVVCAKVQNLGKNASERPTVEQSLNRHEAEFDARIAALADAKACTLDLKPVLVLRLGQPEGAPA